VADFAGADGIVWHARGTLAPLVWSPASRIASAVAIALSALAASGCSRVAGAEALGGTSEAYTTEHLDEFTPEEWAEVRTRCTVPSNEPVIVSSDYRWDYTLPEMTQRYQEMYVSPKRLKDRARYDAATDRLLLPLPSVWGGPAALPARIVKSVSRHIETALARNYADAIFFPDMGHTHFFIPDERWATAYQGMPVAETAKRYTKFFEDPELRVLYHTAEQLKTRNESGPLPDRKLQWRFFTRSLVGDNRGLGFLEPHHDPSNVANTVKSFEGHRYYGAGFNLSANERGCFHFSHRGQTFHFDISLKDIESEGGGI